MCQNSAFQWPCPSFSSWRRVWERSSACLEEGRQPQCQGQAGAQAAFRPPQVTDLGGWCSLSALLTVDSVPWGHLFFLADLPPFPCYLRCRFSWIRRRLLTHPLAPSVPYTRSSIISLTWRNRKGSQMLSQVLSWPNPNTTPFPCDSVRLWQTTKAQDILLSFAPSTCLCSSSIGESEHIWTTLLPFLFSFPWLQEPEEI